MQALKVGQIGKYGREILIIREVKGNWYKCSYSDGGAFLNERSGLKWGLHYEFDDIAPEGLTLEEAKLYFAL